MKTYFLVDFDSTIMFKSDSFLFDVTNMLCGEYAEIILNPPKGVNFGELFDYFVFQTDIQIKREIAKQLYFEFKKTDVGVKIFELMAKQDNFFINKNIKEFEEFLSAGNSQENIKFWYLEQVVYFFNAVYTVLFQKRDIVPSFMKFYNLVYARNNKVIINTLQGTKGIEWIIELFIRIDPVKYFFLKDIPLYGGSMITSKRDSNRIAYILFSEKILNDTDVMVVVVGDNLIDVKNYNELTKYRNPSDFVLSFPQNTELLVDREKCEKLLSDIPEYLPNDIVDRIKRSYKLQIDIEDSGKESKYGAFGGHFHSLIDKGLI